MILTNFLDYNPFDKYKESDKYIFEDLKIRELKIGELTIEEY